MSFGNSSGDFQAYGIVCNLCSFPQFGNIPVGFYQSHRHTRTSFRPILTDTVVSPFPALPTLSPLVLFYSSQQLFIHHYLLFQSASVLTFAMRSLCFGTVSVLCLWSCIYMITFGLKYHWVTGFICFKGSSFSFSAGQNITPSVLI